MPHNLLAMGTFGNKLAKAWIIAVLSWCCVRIAGAGVFLSSYHISVKTFAAIELSSSLLLAISTTKFVEAVHRHHPRDAVINGFLTLIGYTAPDVYLLRTGRGLPWLAYVVILGLMLIGGGFSAIQLRRRLRSNLTPL